MKHTRPGSRQRDLCTVSLLLGAVCILGLVAAATELFGGAGMPVLLAMVAGRCVVVGMLPALAAVAVHGWLREARSDRRGFGGAALCLCCALLVPLGGRWLERQAEHRQVVRLAGVDERVAPLLAALRSYTRDHGAAPRELSSLVPRYLSHLPGTNAGNNAALSYARGASRRLHYRLAGGGELCLWMHHGVQDAELVGAGDARRTEFDPWAWRRGRSPSQAAAFVRLAGPGLARDSALSMLGLPDWRDTPPEGAWSLDASAFTGRRGRGVLYLPFERYPAPAADGRGHRLGRWWLYEY